MKKFCRLLAGLLATLPTVWAQSNIDESRVRGALHVDNLNPAATPTGPGAAAQSYLSFSGCP